MFKIKKLNQAGFAHHFLLAAAVIVIGVASFGAYQLVASHADTYSAGSTITIANSRGCFDAGRNWDSAKNTCATTCRPGAGVPKNGYCDNAIAQTISLAQCNSLHRLYVASYGCARRADQTTTPNAPQCQSGYPTYVNEATDVCKAVAAAPASPTPRPVAPTPIKSTTAPKAPVTAASSTPTPTFDSTSQQLCLMNGRNYSAGHGCETSCPNLAAGTYKKDSKSIGYCSNAYTEVSLINQAKCADLKRVWNNTVPGCARDYHEAASPSNAVQCLSGFPKYIPGVTGKNFAYCEKNSAPNSNAVPAAAHDNSSANETTNNKDKTSSRPSSNPTKSPAVHSNTPSISVNDKMAFCHNIPTGGRYYYSNGSCGTCRLTGYVEDGYDTVRGYGSNFNTCVKSSPVVKIKNLGQSTICRIALKVPSYCKTKTIQPVASGVKAV